MTSDQIFSPVSALANFLKACSDARQVVMSEAAWDAVMEEALRTVVRADIVNNHDGERSFNGVRVMLHNERR